MFRWLLPKKDVFFEHMEACASKAVEIARAYKDLVAHLDEVEVRVAALTEIEHQADERRHELLLHAVGSLCDLRHPEPLRELLIQIHTLENAADAILRPALGELFRIHSDTRLIIKWKEVYEHLETATDMCEDVADQIENILLEYS